jgi:hypothetical protein
LRQGTSGPGKLPEELRRSLVTEILAQITGGNFCAGIYLVDDILD